MLLGELAAIGTSLAFSAGSTLFTLAGRAVGSGTVNRIRLVLALLFTMVLHWLLLGSFYPLNTSPEAFFWMAMSGLVGYILGDVFLFQGFVLIGPRLSMLMMALAPVLSTIMAWLLLHETLAANKIAGIIITMIGIALVVAGPRPTTRDEQHPHDPRTYIIGLLCAFGGAVGQAGGSLLSKIGLSGGLPPISGNAIRLTAAVLGIWLWTLVRGQLKPTIAAIQRRPGALRYIVFATLCGPVIGVWLSLVSVQLAPLGVATTLQSLTPIFLIPIGYFVFKERITLFAIVGSVIALIGSFMLF